MDIYLGKNRTCAIAGVIVTCATIAHLAREVEAQGHKPYMDNFFSWPNLFDD
jgi:hypothetical protein